MLEDKLNLTYYSGQDLYSDGDVEEELLATVSEGRDNIEKTLIEGNSWPHLYHLSDIRKNILDWYDFDPKGSLLEIGSGCGALSGLFCSKVDHVVAIELSKRRSMINVTRNSEYDNLTIMLGNFEDIKLEEKFDYVTLIGVFEYSIYYINSKNPFMDMLERAKNFLKPGGKLIIAIENKYGLKYFAGATEDHTGRFADGLENYVSTDRIRTFSHKTLEKMLREAGFGVNNFYYPMPDYKLPDTIYSEGHMPGRGSIRSACTSYDRDRYELIDERLAFDAICEDEMFGDFANSFLVVSGMEELEAKTTTEYAKYTRLRAPQYQIVTKIVRDEQGQKVVYKEALREEAKGHINRLAENREKLLKAGSDVTPVELIECNDGKAVFPFVKGESLEDIISNNLTGREDIMTAIFEACCVLYENNGKALRLTDFEMTEEFANVFGSDYSEEELQLLNSKKCMKISNIDSTFANIVKDDNGVFICLDYEWIADCPIPEDYLKYRTVYYYFCDNRPYVEKYISEKEYMTELGFSEEDLELYGHMDDNFQQYVHGKDRKYIYTKNYGKNVINLGKDMQNGESWFQSIMEDVNRLNTEIGEHRRDLVSCRVDMRRKSELGEKIVRNLKNPLNMPKKIARKLMGRK